MVYKDPEYSKHYYQAHKDSMKAQIKEYVQSHPEQYAGYRHSQRRKEWEKEWRKNNAEKRKDSRLRMRYGITLDAYNSLYQLQDGCCAICGKKMEVPVVDHNHKTGKVRSLLCSPCNAALGGLQENIELFYKAIDYLKGWSKETENASI